jgi:hypothetical protein
MSHGRRVVPLLASVVAIAILVLGSGGCDDVSCPYGTMRIGDRCRPLDPVTAGEMANTTAGTASVAAGTSASPATSVAGTGVAQSNAGTGVGATPSSPAAGASAGAPMTMTSQGGSSSMTSMGSMASMAMSSMAAGGAGSTGSNANAGAGGDAPPAGPPPCDVPGAQRCLADGSGRREACSGGVWTETSACRSDEVCTGLDSAEPGSCLMKAAVCSGNAGRSTCDGAGTLYQCDQNGVIEMQQSCGSLELCKPALMTGRCATCVPGAARCTGNRLEKCSSSGDGYGSPMECATADLCDATGGRCRDAACDPDEWTCRGDVLYKCNAQQTDFQMVQSCGRGLCNASKHACNACSPGQAPQCNGKNRVTCSADGSKQDSVACPAACSNGECVECLPSDTKPCGTGCERGVQRCVNGHFDPTCDGSNPQKSTETCNGKDDDCDGQIDNCKAPTTINVAFSCMGVECLPTGSYLDTCTGCRVIGQTLRCSCKDSSNPPQWQEAQCSLAPNADGPVEGIWQAADDTHPNGGGLICGH